MVTYTHRVSDALYRRRKTAGAFGWIKNTGRHEPHPNLLHGTPLVLHRGRTGGHHKELKECFHDTTSSFKGNFSIKVWAGCVNHSKTEKGAISMTRTMTEKEQQILDTFAEIIPRLSELDKERLLMFGEGMKFKVEEQAKAV